MFARLLLTDKRTDVWSRDFIIWKINSGLWAVVWAGLWNKRVCADYEHLLRPVFFYPEKVKKRASKVAHNRPNPFFSQSSPDHNPQPKIDFSYYEISGPDICSLICG